MVAAVDVTDAVYVTNLEVRRGEKTHILRVKLGAPGGP
jgi:hypothetical protein